MYICLEKQRSWNRKGFIYPLCSKTSINIRTPFSGRKKFQVFDKSKYFHFGSATNFVWCVCETKKNSLTCPCNRQNAWFMLVKMWNCHISSCTKLCETSLGCVYKFFCFIFANISLKIVWPDLSRCDSFQNIFALLCPLSFIYQQERPFNFTLLLYSVLSLYNDLIAGQMADIFPNNYWHFYR